MDFDEFVKRENADVAADGSDMRDGLLAEWKKRLAELYNTIRGFLKPYTDKKEIVIDETDSVEIREDALGSYKAPSMKITVGKKGKKISLMPIGTDILAAKGRVDMTGPNGRFKIVLVDSKLKSPMFESSLPDKSVLHETPKRSELAWRFVTSPPNMRYVGMDQQTFFDAVIELTEEY